MPFFKDKVSNLQIEIIRNLENKFEKYMKENKKNLIEEGKKAFDLSDYYKNFNNEAKTNRIKEELGRQALSFATGCYIFDEEIPSFEREDNNFTLNAFCGCLQGFKNSVWDECTRRINSMERVIVEYLTNQEKTLNNLLDLFFDIDHYPFTMKEYIMLSLLKLKYANEKLDALKKNKMFEKERDIVRTLKKFHEENKNAVNITVELNYNGKTAQFKYQISNIIKRVYMIDYPIDGIDYHPIKDKEAILKKLKMPLQAQEMFLSYISKIEYRGALIYEDEKYRN